MVWNKAESVILGAVTAIITQDPSFPLGVSSTSSLGRAWDAVENLWCRDMQNLYPPATAPLHIFFPNPSRKRVSSEVPVLAWRSISLVVLLTVLFFYHTPSSSYSYPSPNDIFEAGDPSPVLKRYITASSPSPSLPYPNPLITTPKLYLPRLLPLYGSDWGPAALDKTACTTLPTSG